MNEYLESLPVEGNGNVSSLEILASLQEFHSLTTTTTTLTILTLTFVKFISLKIILIYWQIFY